MHFGLFARLALSIAALLIAALLTLGYVLLQDVEERLQQERASLAQAQTKTLANGSIDALITGDYELLERWVSSVTPADYYAYAYLVRANGQVLTHTDIQQVGRSLDPLGKLDQPVKRVVNHEVRPIHEVVHPARVGDQHLANAVIGYYTDINSFYTNQAALEIILIIGLFLSLLLGATLLIIRKHIQPLTELTNTMTMTSLGAASINHPGPVLLARNDEVGALAREYGKLLDRLEQSYHDLQHEEQRQRQLVAQRTQKLHQSNQELEAFAYSVSHDLRSPLRSINGFCHILEEDYAGQLDDAGKHHLARIRNGSQRMAQLIDDLLSLSRVTRADLTLQSVNLSELVEKTVAELQGQDPQRNVTITVAKDITVQGDATLLSLAIQNLISNAWKYTGKVDQAIIEFGIESEDDETIYFIKDNGAGFNMEYAGKLFGTFQRLHREDEFEGSGIGLATVWRVIQRHGGRIWAKAEPDKGATFFFTLAAAKSH